MCLQRLIKKKVVEIVIVSLLFLGSQSILYFSFDTLSNLVLMEGNTQANFCAIVPGQVRLHSFCLKLHHMVFNVW